MSKNNLEWQNGEYKIRTNKELLQIDLILDYLVNQSYWAKNRTAEQMQTVIENSLCFGLYRESRQIGFARVVTDFATFAYLGDVYVLPEFQGEGLGKWLIEVVVNHPDLQGFRRWILATRDAHMLYEKYGFKIIPDSKSMYADKIPIVDMIRPGEGQKYPNLNPRLEIKDSPVEGRGIFTKVPFKKGVKIVINIDPQPIEVYEFTDEEFDKFRQDCIKKGLQWDSVSIGDGKHRAAIAAREKNPENYGNHSCDPNLSADHVALRDIESDEELTVDYAEFSDVNWSMECHCGSKNCEGTVKGKVE